MNHVEKVDNKNEKSIYFFKPFLTVLEKAPEGSDGDRRTTDACARDAQQDHSPRGARVQGRHVRYP